MKKFFYVWFQLATSRHYWLSVPVAVMLAAIAIGQFENPSLDAFLYVQLPILLGVNLLFSFAGTVVGKVESCRK